MIDPSPPAVHPLRPPFHETPPASPAPVHSFRWGKLLAWLIAIVVIAAAGGLIAYRIHTNSVAATATANSARGGRGRGGGGGGPLPVIGDTVSRGNLDLYLDGLGSATPLNTVTLRSRVDGAIEKIAYTEGQAVKQGDFLLQIDPRPYQAALEQAQGLLAKDQATKTNADWLVKQDEEALRTKAIAQQQMYTDTAARDQALGAIEVDKATIDNARLNLDYCRITAPISGRIGLRMVDVGNLVHASDSTGLAVITQLQPIAVVFTLPEDVVSRVVHRIDGRTPVQVQAWDRDLRKKLATGTVLAIDNQIDANSGTVKVKAVFENADNELFPNEFVNARLLVQTLTDVTIAPTAAVQHGTSGLFVWTVDADGNVKMHDVSTGATEGDQTVITSGVEFGQTVVTDGVDKLADGMAVSMHAPASATSPPTIGPAGATTRPHRRRGAP